MSREFRAYIKSSTPAAIWWFRLEYLVPAGRRLFSGPDGSIVTLQSPIQAAKHATPFFDGPVCMLIGPATFSSATDLAAAVKDFHLATLIGEETGGRANSFGEAYPFELPNSRLIASVASAYFVRASGDTTDRRGVMPDIEIRRSADDVGANRDPVLERAKACPARPAP
jgi:C-terminal processing protease CtpA/Prc